MNILVSGFFIGLLLLAVPLFISYRFRLNMETKLLIVLGRLAVTMGLLGLAIYFALKWNSVVFNFALLLLFCAFSAFLSLSRSRQKGSKLFLLTLGGNVVAVVLISLYFLLAIAHIEKPFAALFFVPVAGLLTGCMVRGNAKALEEFHAGLVHHDQLYYYLLGNGATHRKAIAYFIRRSLKAAFAETLRQTKTVVFLTSPTLFFAMVMGGMDVFTAAAMQVLFGIMLLAAVLLSTCFTLFAGQRFCFDQYERLKQKNKNAHSEKTESASLTADAPTSETNGQAALSSDSLSNPSTHPGTDFANQPPTA